MDADWTDEYQNIAEAYFWEPQRLNRVSPGKSRRKPIDDVMRTLMRGEVPLNHQLNLFFRLAPSGLKERWMQSLFPNLAIENPRLVNDPALRRSKLFEACQPDLFFDADRARVFVEMKVDARSSLEQLTKYALFAATWSIDREPKPAALIFIGPTAARFAELGSHLERRHDPIFELPTKVRNHVTRLSAIPEAVIEAVRSMSVEVTTYEAFDTFLEAETERIEFVSDASETLLNLIAGLRRFLRSLGVVSSAMAP